MSDSGMGLQVIDEDGGSDGFLNAEKKGRPGHGAASFLPSHQPEDLSVEELCKLSGLDAYISKAEIVCMAK